MDNIDTMETNLHTISGGHISIFHKLLILYNYMLSGKYMRNDFNLPNFLKKLETFPLCDLHNKNNKKEK